MSPALRAAVTYLRLIVVLWLLAQVWWHVHWTVAVLLGYAIGQSNVTHWLVTQQQELFKAALRRLPPASSGDES